MRCIVLQAIFNKHIPIPIPIPAALFQSSDENFITKKLTGARVIACVGLLVVDPSVSIAIPSLIALHVTVEVEVIAIVMPTILHVHELVVRRC